MESDEVYAVDSVSEYAEASAESGAADSIAENDFKLRMQIDKRDASYEPNEAPADVDAEQVMSEGEALPVSSLKRPAGANEAPKPFKRQKGMLNMDYLDLLNRDIEDAAFRVNIEDDFKLKDCQFGLVTWSSAEKLQFFEALSRLGRCDLLGISAQVGTKSAIEVQHYIHLLQDAVDERKRDGFRSFLETAEVPAAVELSPQCCHAQEEAADAMSIRLELKDAQREAQKWGPIWDVTPEVADSLCYPGEEGDEEAGPAAAPEFARLFQLDVWLQLSGRVFMNSSIPSSNWQFLDDGPPSMWATTFDDFYSLTVSITRRLVQTALFISMSRIRAKREHRAAVIRDIVRKRDVEAAVASLGWQRSACAFWQTSARRLRLDVFRDLPDGHDGDADSDGEPMTYEEVESALSALPEMSDAATALDAQALRSRFSTPSQGEGDDEDARALDDETPASPGQDQGVAEDDDGADEDVDQEFNEFMWCSSVGLRDARGAKEAIRLRIVAERQQEDQAAAHDEFASFQAETEMWAILQKKPPTEAPKVPQPGPLRRSKATLAELLPVAGHWTDKLDYYGEWETTAAMDRAEDTEQ